MKIFFLKALFWLQLQVGNLLDKLFKIFNVFAGIDEVNVTENGTTESTDLLSYFLSNDTVQAVFWALVIIGVAVATVLTMIALGKSMFTKKKATQIVGKYVVGVTSSVLVAVFMIAIVAIANFFLLYINTAFKGQMEDRTVSERIIENCVEPPTFNEDGKIKDPGGWLYKKGSKKEIYTLSDIKNIDSASTFFGKWKTIFGFESEGGSDDDAIKDDITAPGETPPATNSDDRRTGGFVNINKYDFVMGLFTSVVLLIVALTASMGLVSRLFDLIFLMLTGPLLTATIPLDDGAKFKLWRETVISKTMLAYGTVFAINIYLVVLPLINFISIPGDNGLTQIMRLLLLLCGGLTISTGQILFSRLIGTSAEESRQMTHGMRQMFGGAMATMGMAKGAGRMVFGTRNQMTGKRERGLFQRTFGTKGRGDNPKERQGGFFRNSGKVGNAGGKVLFGGGYKEPIKKGKEGVGKFAKNKWDNNMEGGGVAGRVGKHMDSKKIDNWAKKR